MIPALTLVALAVFSFPALLYFMDFTAAGLPLLLFIISSISHSSRE